MRDRWKLTLRIAASCRGPVVFDMCVAPPASCYLICEKHVRKLKAFVLIDIATGASVWAMNFQNFLDVLSRRRRQHCLKRSFYVILQATFPEGSVWWHGSTCREVHSASKTCCLLKRHF
mmetsp:Transcript_16477/g.31088  ORF Transcript_16477/g.31088 Transcript_16477/m.31088 type:complete len:119 (-) Transcript_16477:210-566(-)